MMKKFVLFIMCAILLGSCVNKETDLYDPEAIEQKTINDNALKYFPEIDSKQDWCPITTGIVTIKADADLSDIVKVQILTESPFFNDDCKVLNEAEAKNGQSVTLNYDAPDMYKELVAACVDSRGVYYIQVFNVGDKQVSFAKQTRALTRAVSASETPNAADIKLEYKNSIQSFNALRAQLGTCIIKDDSNKDREYTNWQNTNWAGERLWSPSNANLGEWAIADGSVFRPVTALTSQEEANIRTICDTYLVKNGSGNDATFGKRNNWKRILDGKYFTVNNNYLVSNGTPVTLTPVQMNSTEVSYNSIYYYYYDPAQVAGMSSEQETAFIQALPKYKAIHGWHAKNAANKAGKTGAAYFKVNEYLLPYYGDAVPGTTGATAVSCVIPKGYKIGFLNRKRVSDNTDNCRNGCTYGDGRLNDAVNHIAGHFLSAMDKSLGGQTTEGMDFTSPRIAIFSANNTTYMCFEDGSDCNFCDMIVEVSQGTEIIEEAEKPEAAAYTMCFEDRPDAADYDMNDVVLQATRPNATHIQISVIACGAMDKVVLHGIQGSKLFNDAEIHDIFGLEEGQYFVNTEVGGLHMNPMSEVIKVDASTRIENFLKQIYIENLTTQRTIKMPTPGYAPHAIIVPENFKYPMEKQNITSAYAEFLNWAKDINASNDWYKFGEADKIFSDLFEKW